MTMEKKLHHFLNSNLLYKHLIGETTDAESAEVDYYILNYPEAAEAWHSLQNNLEILAKYDAVDAPPAVLDTVMDSIELKNTSTQDTNVVAIHPRSKTPWYSIAASITALLFAVTTFFLYQKNQALHRDADTIVEEIYDLREDIEKNNSKLNQLSEEFYKLNDPDALKYVLAGNERAKDLKTVAYINPVDKTSTLDIISVPQLPENQYYEIKAELEGRMISLGILDPKDTRTRKEVQYMEDASALSIVIKTKGDSTVTNITEVAEISLKD